MNQKTVTRRRNYYDDQKENFMHYDEAAGTWRLKHGDYRIYVGSSLLDIRLTQDITI